MECLTSCMSHHNHNHCPSLHPGPLGAVDSSLENTRLFKAPNQGCDMMKKLYVSFSLIAMTRIGYQYGPQPGYIQFMLRCINVHLESYWSQVHKRKNSLKYFCKILIWLYTRKIKQISKYLFLSHKKIPKRRFQSTDGKGPSERKSCFLLAVP